MSMSRQPDCVTANEQRESESNAKRSAGERARPGAPPPDMHVAEAASFGAPLR
jgi:hypothetical protein